MTFFFGGGGKNAKTNLEILKKHRGKFGKTGPTRTGPTGTRPTGTGPTRTGPTGTRPTRTGPTGTGPPDRTGPERHPRSRGFPSKIMDQGSKIKDRGSN